MYDKFSTAQIERDFLNIVRVLFLGFLIFLTGVNLFPIKMEKWLKYKEYLIEMNG